MIVTREYLRTVVSEKDLVEIENIFAPYSSWANLETGLFINYLLFIPNQDVALKVIANHPQVPAKILREHAYWTAQQAPYTKESPELKAICQALEENIQTGGEGTPKLAEAQKALLNSGGTVLDLGAFEWAATAKPSRAAELGWALAQCMAQELYKPDVIVVPEVFQKMPPVWSILVDNKHEVVDLLKHTILRHFNGHLVELIEEYEKGLSK